MTVEFAIDPNLRVDGNNTLAGFEDLLSGDVAELGDGLPVNVREPESGVIGEGHVVRVDTERQLVFLAVDWKSLHFTA